MFVGDVHYSLLVLYRFLLSGFTPTVEVWGWEWRARESITS